MSSYKYHLTLYEYEIGRFCVYKTHDIILWSF